MPNETTPAPEVAHSLTLQFGRVLSQAEWREVVEKARQLPFVQGLRADATPLPGESAPEVARLIERIDAFTRTTTAHELTWQQIRTRALEILAESRPFLEALSSTASQLAAAQSERDEAVAFNQAAHRVLNDGGVPADDRHGNLFLEQRVLLLLQRARDAEGGKTAAEQRAEQAEAREKEAQQERDNATEQMRRHWAENGKFEERLRVLTAQQKTFQQILADVVKHARPAFPKTPFRAALDKARDLLSPTSATSPNCTCGHPLSSHGKTGACLARGRGEGITYDPCGCVSPTSATEPQS